MIQVGDMVLIDRGIGIVTAYSTDLVIAKCHDGLTHKALPKDCELILSGDEVIKQYEEAVINYDKH